MSADVQSARLGVLRPPLLPLGPWIAWAAVATSAVVVMTGLLATPTNAAPAVIAVRAVLAALPLTFGLLRLGRRRTDRFAWLLVAAGIFWSLALLAESRASSLYSVGRVAAWLVEPVLVLTILTFPEGRVHTSAQRRLAAAVGLLVGTLYLPTALLAPYPTPSPWSSCGTHCPANAFLLTQHAAGLVDDVIRPAREVLGVALLAVVAATIARRMRRSCELVRWTLMPVVAVAVIRALSLPGYFVARRTGQETAILDAIGWWYICSLALLAVGCAGGLVVRRLVEADALERLSRTLSTRPNPAELRLALAEALKDPSLEVFYAAPNTPDGWVDESGRRIAAPRARPDRALTDVSSDGRRLASIDHHEGLKHDDALLGAIVRYVATALENDHLVAELRSSVAAQARARARLVTVAYEERRRIERDLHDGAQQRLVALQIKLELLAERLEHESPEGARRVRALEDEVAATLDEVRRFARGVYPPLLVDRGLTDALRAVARSAVTPTTVNANLAHRYPPEIESAVYFACLEALQNVAKHAHGATRARISVSGNGHLRFEVTDDGVGFDPARTPTGAGLVNLRDRVEALGGRLEIASQPGKGTGVTGTIPVAGDASSIGQARGKGYRPRGGAATTVHRRRQSTEDASVADLWLHGA